MLSPQISEVTETRKMTGAFLGLNHNPRISDGELYWMKNLTSDYFPLLSPRKKRTLALSLADNEWESVSLTITKEYHGDIAQKYALWKTGDITIESNTPYSLAITDVLTTFSTLTVDITYTGSSKTESFTVDKNSWTQEFITPADATKMNVVIKGVAADPETFDEDDLDTYITSITLAYKNMVIRGIVCRGSSLVYMIGHKFYYNDQTYDMSSYMPAGDDKISKQQLVIFGAYVIAFPANVYLNLIDPTDKGALGNKNTLTGTATYSLCDKDGNAITATVSVTAPANPSDGDYWLRSSADPGLFIYYDSLGTWVQVTTTYISISMTNIGKGFEVGDAVFMNTKLSDINEGSIIQARTDNSIVVIAVMKVASDTETFTSGSPLVVERKIPKLTSVCVSNNRIWGCYYGEEGDKVINEIHASKLGDPKNWYTYAGVSTDSYSLSLGDEGVFTGAFSYQGYPMFFKENIVYKIYGYYPAQYQLVTFDCRGVQIGSEKSIARVGEYLFYKSDKDVVIFDGSYPRTLSNKLGTGMYYKAAAGSCLNKYYISMEDEEGNTHLFVYDLDKSLWHREDDLDIEEFAYSNSGQLYGQSGLKLYGFGEAKDSFDLDEDEQERIVEWEAITGEYGFDSPDTKEPTRLQIRARITFKSVITVYISYDDSEWQKLTDLEGKEKVTSIAFPVRLNRKCDHYRLKLEGRGDAKVYSITETEEVGSDNGRY